MTRPGPVQFIKTASEVASYYGFRPFVDLEPSAPRASAQRAPSFAEAAALCASFAVKRQEPVLAFYATSAPSHTPHHLVPRETAEFSLHLSGTEESIGEILLLKTLSSIADEWGLPVVRVRINAMGDRDSRERFRRELGAYVRRRAEDLPEPVRERLMQEPLALYSLPHDETTDDLLSEAPRPVHFLSEKSRLHFREVLEHLEELAIPYQLDDTLMGDERMFRIAFCVDLAGEDSVVLGNMGGRFDDPNPRAGGRGAISASIYFRKKGADRGSLLRARGPKPKVYFIQLGLRAKLAGFSVIDALRREHIHVMQGFDTAKFSPQLLAAQEIGVEYVLIMGQREALDRTVIVRELRNSSQTIVEIGRLPKALRALKA